MDSQEVFNKVADHLARQKVPALGIAGGCVLRSDNGTKCAVGCLVPDNQYHPDMEMDSGIYFHSNGKLNTWVKKTFSPTPEQYRMVADLQICHDDASYGRITNHREALESAKKKWPLGMENVAKSFGLVFDRAAFEKNLNDINYTY